MLQSNHQMGASKRKSRLGPQSRLRYQILSRGRASAAALYYPRGEDQAFALPVAGAQEPRHLRHENWNAARRAAAPEMGRCGLSNQSPFGPAIKGPKATANPDPSRCEANS